MSPEARDFVPQKILTPEEARNVPLSLNPLKRLGQLATYGAPFTGGIKRAGWSPLPDIMTRSDLVRFAETNEIVNDQLQIVDEAISRDKTSPETE